jgi:hypothetical protein
MGLKCNVVGAFKNGFNETCESGYMQHILFWRSAETQATLTFSYIPA